MWGGGDQHPTSCCCMHQFKCCSAHGVEPRAKAKTKKKKQGSFCDKNSCQALFVMMDYITGLTGMSIMAIWWCSNEGEQWTVGRYYTMSLKTCHIQGNSLRWAWNGEVMTVMSTEPVPAEMLLSCLIPFRGEQHKSCDWATHAFHLSPESLFFFKKKKQKCSLHGLLCFDFWKSLSDFYPSRWHAY